ncbi:response regulator [Mariniblastus fucicola]|uniref:Transcriptional regulatory protein TcrA n=1 Tax=Mariniblastus fucicola TaxID=980251 RepID=A0A5B9PD43_9BACT|nr:response regulator [Mariniblastus fucicola]QEG22832.1 Transcriptional regulatory protein TcrA [Mariniblastus fucicola]
MTRILSIQNSADNTAQNLWNDSQIEVTEIADFRNALSLIMEKRYDGVYFSGVPECLTKGLSGSEVLDCIPMGVALLDQQNRIIFANKRLTGWFPDQEFVGLNFYEAVGSPSIIGSEPSPLSSAVARSKRCEAEIQIGDRYFVMSVTPVIRENEKVEQLVVSLFESTETTEQRQKLTALHQAGVALADLRPEEIYEMEIEERIELLKDNIIHYTNDLLDFDVIEVRLVDPKSKLMTPLLSVGINSGVAERPLFAKATENGVTGFVAATGKSYLCEDTTNDPIYLDGLMGAKSSLTVPLKHHNEVIGSFNIESPEVGRFTESDLRFVECFAHDIANAINTLNLLNAQQTNTALRSVEAVRSAVALPVDQILNDAVQAIGAYIGHDPAVTARLSAILENARTIKKAIQAVGQEMTCTEEIPQCVKPDSHPLLFNKRILVIDADKEVRSSAHMLLEKYGCVVETACEGREAILMVKNSGDASSYDAIIADIRLPDIGGYELLIKLREFVPNPPLVLMTGFGYDPGHSIVKAREAGLRANAVLFKPFRLDQLLKICEETVLHFDSQAAK